MSQSAHRQVSLWRYERPSRGYDGLHLRARTPEARQEFHDRLAALPPSEPHLFKFGESEAATFPELRWKREVFASALVTIGAAPPRPDDGGMIHLSLGDRSRADLLSLLMSVAPDEEGSVDVKADGQAASLFVWWDTK